MSIATDSTKRKPAQDWREALDRADADIAAGRVVDGATVRQRLRNSIARMEARLTQLDEDSGVETSVPYLTLYSLEAVRQIDEPRAYFEKKSRLEALRNLDVALTGAEQRVDRRPDDSVATPRPYPQLARPDRAWIKSGRYWIAFTLVRPPIIVAVFFDGADIPGRYTS